MPIYVRLIIISPRSLEGELSTVFTKSNLTSNVANPQEKFKLR